MKLFNLALKSLLNRKTSVCLTIVSISLSLFLFLGIQKVHTSAKNSFLGSVSNVDLIVGARTGPVQLLLYSVFRLGEATANISWQSFKEFSQDPNVAWTIPISLGDSHKGYRVVGTNQDYFKYYRYHGDKTLDFFEGKAFNDLFDVVLGYEVAKELNYALGESIVVSHGVTPGEGALHDNAPFTISGILEKTGTPVDSSVHVSLEAIEAIHVGWSSGIVPDEYIPANELRSKNLEPKSITAFFVGLESKFGLFRFRHKIQQYPKEALMGILPGSSFQQLWESVSLAETALMIVSAMVILTGILGLVATILTSLESRRREMAILRAVGARPFHIFFLLAMEAFLMAAIASILTLGLLQAIEPLAAPMAMDYLGLRLNLETWTLFDLKVCAAVGILCIFSSLIPGWMAYKNSLSDGLSMRL